MLTYFIESSVRIIEIKDERCLLAESLSELMLLDLRNKDKKFPSVSENRHAKNSLKKWNYVEDRFNGLRIINSNFFHILLENVIWFPKCYQCEMVFKHWL